MPEIYDDDLALYFVSDSGTVYRLDHPANTVGAPTWETDRDRELCLALVRLARQRIEDDENKGFS